MPDREQGQSDDDIKFKLLSLKRLCFVFFYRIRHVGLFSEITQELFLSHSEGKDMTATIMKKINTSPNIEGNSAHSFGGRFGL